MARRQYDDDDGRRIADMNVDGMPWYDGSRKHLFRNNGNRERIGADFSDASSGQGIPSEPLTKKETRSIILNALLAALAIGGIFIAVFALLILFCVFVWFK